MHTSRGHTRAEAASARAHLVGRDGGSEEESAEREEIPVLHEFALRVHQEFVHALDAMVELPDVSLQVLWDKRLPSVAVSRADTGHEFVEGRGHLSASIAAAAAVLRLRRLGLGRALVLSLHLLWQRLHCSSQSGEVGLEFGG